MSDPPVKWGLAKRAVIALRDDIKREMADGFSLSAIYDKHHKQLSNITKGAFQRQVRQVFEIPTRPKRKKGEAQLQRVETATTNEHKEPLTHVRSGNPAGNKPLYTPPKLSEAADLIGAPRKPKGA